LLPYGDTPLGEYRIAQLSASGDEAGYPTSKYGDKGVAILEPIAGEAALAEANGRFRLLIQGGCRNRLTPASGSLRLLDEHQREFITALEQLGAMPCVCLPSEKGRKTLPIDLSADYMGTDPPPVPLHPRQLKVELVRRWPLTVDGNSDGESKNGTAPGGRKARGSHSLHLPLSMKENRAHRRHLRSVTVLLSETRWQRLSDKMPTRHCFEAALWRLWTGGDWTALPKEFSNPGQCLRQVQCWYETGGWIPLWQDYINQLSSAERLAWSKSFLDDRFAPKSRDGGEASFDFGFYWTSAKLFLSSWSGPVEPANGQPSRKSRNPAAQRFSGRQRGIAANQTRVSL
jgi:hypothetical protein